MALTCSGTSSWWKWPAPTVMPICREWGDRTRFDEDKRARQGWVPRREFNADHSAEAVPDDNRLVNSHYRAELCKVVCELADGVAILRLVAATATA